MKELFKNIIEYMEAGKDTVLASIIGDSGSTPRGIGARMLVSEDGLICGTIGGGSVEYRSTAMAVDAIKHQASFIKPFTLRKNDVEDLGMICGGDVTVEFQFISAHDADFLQLAKTCLEAFSKSENTWIVTEFTDEAQWRMAIYGANYADTLGIGEAASRLLQSGGVSRTIDGRKYYAEPLTTAGRVIIFGGGHIGAELAPLLVHLSFSVVVFEDRPEFAEPARFPGVQQIVLGDFANIADKLTIRPDDYLVVITRGHSFDYEVQRQALQGQFRYLGVVGSKQKKASVDQRLLDAGIPAERLKAITSPIGLPIKAKTPAEIAVAIAAELIQVRAEAIAFQPRL
jgi:xanthine dehydrogenase accessory factor